MAQPSADARVILRVEGEPLTHDFASIILPTDFALSTSASTASSSSTASSAASSLIAHAPPAAVPDFTGRGAEVTTIPLPTVCRPGCGLPAGFRDAIAQLARDTNELMADACAQESRKRAEREASKAQEAKAAREEKKAAREEKRAAAKPSRRAKREKKQKELEAAGAEGEREGEERGQGEEAVLTERFSEETESVRGVLDDSAEEGYGENSDLASAHREPLSKKHRST